MGGITQDMALAQQEEQAGRFLPQLLVGITDLIRAVVDNDFDEACRLLRISRANGLLRAELAKMSPAFEVSGFNPECSTVLHMLAHHRPTAVSSQADYNNYAALWDMVSAEIKHVRYLDECNGKRQTPLFCACTHNNEPAIYYLLQASAGHSEELWDRLYLFTSFAICVRQQRLWRPPFSSLI